MLACDQAEISESNHRTSNCEGIDDEDFTTALSPFFYAMAERLEIVSRCVAIVDPYSSGAMLASELRQRDTPCVAIQSSPSIPTSFRTRFEREDFTGVIDHRDGLDETLLALTAYEPSHVIAGFESGVELADFLSERLSLPSNGTKMSRARRDKFQMTEAVRAHGLRTPAHFQSSDVDGVVDWARARNNWPVVIKPSASTASDNVHYCTSTEDIRRAGDAILENVNMFGMSNVGVLAQEYLDGVEYIVDTVSCNGERKVSAFWKYSRPPGRDGRLGYNAMTLLRYEGRRQETLRAYAFAVLDALGIKFGPAHCELMWQGDGPVLVEVGARLSAGINAVLSGICGGLSQLDETVSVILEPKRFLNSLSDRASLTRRAMNVFLMPHNRKRLVRLNWLDEIRSLPTLYRLSVTAEIGEPLPRVAGMVTLVHEDLEVIEHDVEVIRYFERNGLYEGSDEPNI